MNKKSLLFLIISLILGICVFVCALTIGKYPISISDFFKAVFTADKSVDIQRSIIFNLRLPRTIMAALTGIGLSLSGLLYQEIFQNKLVSPDILGVSSGSAVGAALAITLGYTSIIISCLSFFFGVVTVLITLFLSRQFKSGKSLTLILAGIIVGGFMSAALSMIKYFADPTTTLSTITFWLMGSFENSTMNTVYILMPIVVLCCVVLITLSWRINIVALGQEEAQTKGINYKLYQLLIICMATLLTASAVAFSGTISWIGLVVPHLVRLVVGRDTRRTIPLCMTFGGLFMMLVDIFSRTFTSQELPVSAVTGLFGTLIFVIILFIQRRNYNVH